MTKLTKQTIHPDRILIKIKGENKKEVIQEFWKFINHGDSVHIRIGAEIESDTGLNWLNDYLFNEAYFRANEERLIKTFQSIALFDILRQKDPDSKWDEIPDKIIKASEKQGIINYHNLEEENILNRAVNEIGKDVDSD